MRRFLVPLIPCVAVTACASTGAVPQPFPTPGGAAVAIPAPPSPAASSPSDAYAISGTALSLRGTPYRNGGSDPAGFDCSGFAWYVFSQHGVRLPRTVGDQFQFGDRVDAADLRAGDLVFFDTAGTRSATHVGISIGGDEFVHAPSSAGQVRVERLGSGYWAPRFIGARRVR
jgi:cell wall-associated NlpC family hydrolase